MSSFATRSLPVFELQLLEAVHSHCRKLILNACDERYTYHNWEHTDRVTREAHRIAEQEGLSDEEYLVLLVAALFHDTGYYEERDGHEECGARNAAQFLTNDELTEDFRANVEQLILETRLSKTPSTEASKVLRDADLHYLGLEKGLGIADALRNEWEVLSVKHFSEKEWLENNIEFFESHKYFTTTAKAIYGPGKARNLQRLRIRLDEH